MTLEAVTARLKGEPLDIFGALHTVPEDGLGDGTVVLLGPREPGFWTTFTASPEWQDGAPDPMDRWSTRVINAAARDLGATPLFPFGAPVRPFFTWALRSGRAWASPVMLLVHDTAGLLVSYRAALFLPECHPLPEPPHKPCDTCTGKPCLTACPVSALNADGYDLPTCHAYLDTTAGTDCMDHGCAVRRACPVSQGYGRVPEHSAYHMRQFHR